uniref:Uncharacterized protein n=1 Tax=Anguilla anguilla TaxID=7936 RepID=A0A0E9VJ93_ANGAN
MLFQMNKQGYFVRTQTNRQQSPEDNPCRRYFPL